MGLLILMTSGVLVVKGKDLAALGLRVVLGGTLSTMLTATIAGILVGG